MGILDDALSKRERDDEQKRTEQIAQEEECTRQKEEAATRNLSLARDFVAKAKERRIPLYGEIPAEITFFMSEKPRKKGSSTRYFSPIPLQVEDRITIPVWDLTKDPGTRASPDELQFEGCSFDNKGGVLAREDHFWITQDGYRLDRHLSESWSRQLKVFTLTCVKSPPPDPIYWNEDYDTGQKSPWLTLVDGLVTYLSGKRIS